MTTPPHRPVVAVVGATGTGKSELALVLAERLLAIGQQVEIVNADAMQLYRGMDIGTAKLPVAARRGVAHHLLDVLDVTQEASVAAYQRHAREAIAGILERGHLPLLVGGSGLYVRAVLDHLDIPPTDAAVRARFETMLTDLGVERLYALLQDRDAVAAAAIEPRNGRRIVRALEVIELTGRPFSASLPRREYAAPAVQVGLRRDRAELDARVEQRVERMWRDGLLDEVRALVPRGLRTGSTASRAIGYQQALAQLDGTMDRAAAVESTQTATRRYIRRQESWFGRDPRVEWFDAAAPDLADRVGQVVAQALEGRARQTMAGVDMPDNGAHD